jgi:hypothetical protein
LLGSTNQTLLALKMAMTYPSNTNETLFTFKMAMAYPSNTNQTQFSSKAVLRNLSRPGSAAIGGFKTILLISIACISE